MYNAIMCTFTFVVPDLITSKADSSKSYLLLLGFYADVEVKMLHLLTRFIGHRSVKYVCVVYIPKHIMTKVS